MDKLKEKMKSRLDAFSDAIIAIIITIMVLDLPIKHLSNGAIDYRNLFIAIAIYGGSFLFVGNLWYQHADIFDGVDKIPNLTVVTDLILVFFMSLIPTFTNLMTEDTNQLNVGMYGILCLIIMVIFRIIVGQLSNVKYQYNSKVKELFALTHSKNFNVSITAYVVLLVIGFFIPKVALGLFFLIPIWSFFECIKEYGDFDLATMGRAKDFGRFTQKLTPEQQQKLKIKLVKTLKETAGMSKDKKIEVWKNFSNWVEEQK